MINLHFPRAQDENKGLTFGGLGLNAILRHRFDCQNTPLVLPKPGVPGLSDREAGVPLQD